MKCFVLFLLSSFTISLISGASLEVLFTCLGRYLSDLSSVVTSPFEQCFPSTEKESFKEENQKKRVSHHIPSSLKSKIEFDDLSPEILGRIGEYLPDSTVKFGSVNTKLRNLFHEIFPREYYVNERLKIPQVTEGLIDKNDKELTYLLELSWSSKNSFAFFGSLLEDIASEKTEYKKLFIPLMAYLTELFKTFSPEKQQEYRNYLLKKLGISYEAHLGNIYIRHGQYDLAFNLVKNNHRDLINCFSAAENREAVMEFFKSNPELADHYQRAFLDIEIYVNIADLTSWEAKKWIAECVIYGAPENFYTDLLRFGRIVLTSLDKELFHSPRVPESNYSSIHDQMQKLFNDYLRPQPYLVEDLSFYYLINDIRFGSIGLEELNLSSFHSFKINSIAKAALLGNKSEIFLEIFRTSFTTFKFLLRDVIDEYKSNAHETPKYFKAIFEVIPNLPSDFEFSEVHLKFIMKFYAINGLTVGQDRVDFKFVAPNNLLDLEFPPLINVNLKNENNNSSFFIDDIFSHMKVVDEPSVSSFLSDYEKLPRKDHRHNVTFELIELIMKTPNLMSRFIEAGIKFSAAPTSKDIQKYLELLESVNLPDKDFFELNILSDRDIANLKSKKQLEIISKISLKSIPFLFLQWESSQMETNNQEMTESEYFEWRIVFSFLIKSDMKFVIKEIKSQGIIIMLRLEYPLEMKKILGH